MNGLHIYYSFRQKCSKHDTFTVKAQDSEKRENKFDFLKICHLQPFLLRLLKLQSPNKSIFLRGES
jgi:hypothetical protein